MSQGPPKSLRFVGFGGLPFTNSSFKLCRYEKTPERELFIQSVTDSSPQAMSSSIRIEPVVKEKNRMGECPVWEEREDALVYVDINSQKVCRWSAVTGEVQSVSVGKGPLPSGLFAAPSRESSPCLQRERYGPKGCVRPGGGERWTTQRWRAVLLRGGGRCRGDSPQKCWPCSVHISSAFPGPGMPWASPDALGEVGLGRAH